jgi:transcriptional regulator with XRE-family HTH domain
MKLSDYLWICRKRQNAFAKAIGVQPSYVADLLRGRFEPSLKMTQAIFEVTHGLVNLADRADCEEPLKIESELRDE